MLGKSELRPAVLFLFGAGVLFCPSVAQSQHHGGGGHGAGGIPGATGRPAGVDEKDSLKDFHHALAVQATSEQTAEFQALVKETDATKDEVRTFAQPQRKAGAESETSAARNSIKCSSACGLVLQLHYERWSCSGRIGEAGPQELAEGDGAVEVRITPVVGTGGGLRVATEFSRIDAKGALGESMRSGDLGDEIREKVSEGLMPLVGGGLNLETSLPPAVRGSAAVQSARFADVGVGRFAMVYDAQMELSDEQVSLMVSQLNQNAFAQGTVSTQGTASK